MLSRPASFKYNKCSLPLLYIMCKKIKPKDNILLFFFVIIFLSFPRRAQAARIGGAEMTTNIFVGQAYDDNIFLSKHDKKSDRITTIIPHISLNKSKNKSYVNLSYKAHLKFYDENTDENQYPQTGAWDMGLNPTTKSNPGLRGNNIYSYIQRDVREPLVAGRDNVIKRNDFSITPYYNQKIGKKFTTALSYGYTERTFKDESLTNENSADNSDDYEDSESRNGAADMQYRLGSTLRLNGGYNYTSTDFAESTTDYTQQSADGGFTWDIKAKIKISARYGHVWKKDRLNRKTDHPKSNLSLDVYFIKDTVISAAHTRSPSHISSYDTENDYFISHNTSLTIRHDVFNRKIIIHYGGAYHLSDYEETPRKDKSYNGNTRIAWRIAKQASLSLSGHYNKSQYPHYATDNDPTDREDTSSGGGAGLEWTIFKSLNLSLHGKYTRSKYAPEGREDKYYNGNVKLASRVNKNIFFEVGYQYLQNKSNKDDEDNEYIDNKYEAGLRIIF